MAKAVCAVRARAAFLRALRATGSVTAAAGETGISREWFYKQRRRHAGFARNWAKTLERAIAELDAAGARRMRLRGPGDVTGGHAVLWATKARAVQVSKRRGGWTPARQAVFLDWLRAICNVRAACNAVGASTGGVYLKRREDAVFREEWDAAIADGRINLEMALIAAATRMLTGDDPDYRQDLPEVAGMDANIALRILALHGARADGRARWTEGRFKPGDAEAAKASILKKVAAIRRARAAGTA